MDAEIFSYRYSVSYLLMAGVLLLLYLFGKTFDRNGRLPEIYGIFIFVVFFGLRGYIDTDWVNYRPFFDRVPYPGDHDMGTVVRAMRDYPMEKGFFLFTSLVKTVWNDYQFWIFVNALIDILLLRAAVRRIAGPGNFLPVLLFFLVWSGIAMENNAMRNIKSIFLFLVSLPCIRERKFLPFLILNLAGSFFHFSSLLFIPCYFILGRKIPRTVIWAFFIAGNLLFMCRVDLLSQYIPELSRFAGDPVREKTIAYFYNEMYAAPFRLSLGFAEKIITFSLVMLFYGRLVAANRNNLVMINSFVLYLILYYFFSDIRIVALRGSVLFIFPYWFLYPAILSLIRLGTNRFLFAYGLSLFCLLKIATTYNSVIYRYDNVLWRTESFLSRKQVYDRSYHRIIDSE